MHADVAQLVAHHLAKVRVASSSLVIRSHFTGPIDEMSRAFSSAGERFPDTEEVTGSIPVSRTKRTNNLFNQCSCGCSAVGSASPCQGEGREFESRHPLWYVYHVPKGKFMPRWNGRVVRQRSAKPCTRVRFPFPPRSSGAFSSAGERFPDTEEVTGSIPVSRTKRTNNLFNQCSCGCSAVGSASPCQGEGREFESRHPLNLKHLWVNAHRCFCVLPKKRFKGSKCSRWVDYGLRSFRRLGAILGALTFGAGGAVVNPESFQGKDPPQTRLDSRNRS